MTRYSNNADTNGSLRQYSRAAASRLESSGEIEIGCGSFDIGCHSISFAADAGCETFNDDFIAVWRPEQAGSVKWAAAVADGVTGSLMAQEAAELACYAGLASIAKSHANRVSSTSNPVWFATRIFHRLGRQVQSHPDTFRPNDCPESVWRIAIREGKFLQTTLTLIWSTVEGLRVMAVGDGGILYSYLETPTQFTTHTFGTGKLQCLGPRSAVQPEAYLLKDWSSVVCFTDGFAESVEHQRQVPAMLQERDRSVASTIEYLNADCPELVNDNLSAFRVAKV